MIRQWREHDDNDVSVLIKQMCAKSDIISRFVFLQHEAKMLHVAGQIVDETRSNAQWCAGV